MEKNNKEFLDYQKSEVSEVKWVSYKDCFNLIRPYNIEKKDTLERVNKILTTYYFY